MVIPNRPAPRQAYIVIDLGFGDCGKGSIVDFLARHNPVHTVIRFNGGGQAGHNVVTADGLHHTFSQFGSASFVPGVRTHLSRFMVVSPLEMILEGERLAALGLADIFDRTTVSADALVVTPFHWAANHLREYARGEARHGSCGLGVGEAVFDQIRLRDDSLFVRDLADPPTLRRKLRRLQEFKRQDIAAVIEACRGMKEAREELDVLTSPETVHRFSLPYASFPDRVRLVEADWERQMLRQDGTVVFENAQGVLLDQDHGFHPYTTWSRCTPGNALALLNAADYGGLVTKLGLVRAYATRHGPGPFVTESPFLTRHLPDPHNGMDPWQRGFRVGWFDAVATRYAVTACGGVQGLAVSCLDRLRERPRWLACDRYQMLNGSWPAAKGYLDLPFRPLLHQAGNLKSVPVIGDRAYQQALTDILALASPDYEVTAYGDDFAAKCRAHLEWISARTGLPVWIASSGMTAEEKRFVRAG